MLPPLVLGKKGRGRKVPVLPPCTIIFFFLGLTCWSRSSSCLWTHHRCVLATVWFWSSGRLLLWALAIPLEIWPPEGGCKTYSSDMYTKQSYPSKFLITMSYSAQARGGVQNHTSIRNWEFQKNIPGPWQLDHLPLCRLSPVFSLFPVVSLGEVLSSPLTL